MDMGGGDTVIAQFMPLMIVQLIYASIVFVMAKKRRINPWGWTLGSLIPLVGTLVAAIFMLLTMLSILDRLNALEDSRAA